MNVNRLLRGITAKLENAADYQSVEKVSTHLALISIICSDKQELLCPPIKIFIFLVFYFLYIKVNLESHIFSLSKSGWKIKQPHRRNA